MSSLKSAKKILKLLFILSLLCYTFTLFWKPQLPYSDGIQENLAVYTPTQILVNSQPFLKTIENITYRISPVANYEIKGLVVAEYDSQNWLDLTHKNDPAQTKDLCLVWGDNLKDNIFRSVKYAHGEFTCYVSWKNETVKDFRLDELSNNHLFPANGEIAKKIKGAHTADQVRIKGQLINYEILDDQQSVKATRKTSTDRKDRDCEVVYVTEFEILQKPTFAYFEIKRNLLKLVAGFGILMTLLVSVPIKTTNT